MRRTLLTITALASLATRRKRQSNRHLTLKPPQPDKRSQLVADREEGHEQVLHDPRVVLHRVGCVYDTHPADRRLPCWWLYLPIKDESGPRYIVKSKPTASPPNAER